MCIYRLPLTDLHYRSRGCFLKLMYNIRLCCHRCLEKKPQPKTKEVTDQSTALILSMGMQLPNKDNYCKNVLPLRNIPISEKIKNKNSMQCKTSIKLSAIIILCTKSLGYNSKLLEYLKNPLLRHE
jgi:hypothetical protein